jgi:hypothetical protein
MEFIAKSKKGKTTQILSISSEETALSGENKQSKEQIYFPRNLRICQIS